MVKINGRIRGTPTGFVSFIDGTNILGTVPLRGGKARFRTATLPIGRHEIQAVYNGGEDLTPSISAVRIETIKADRSKPA
jgi:hypothetical protein